MQACPWRPAPPHLKFSGSVAASLLRTRGAQRLELLWRMANFSARPPYTRGFAGSGFFHLGENCRPSCWADVASHGPSMNSVGLDYHSFSENEASPPQDSRTPRKGPTAPARPWGPLCEVRSPRCTRCPGPGRPGLVGTQEAPPREEGIRVLSAGHRGSRVHSRRLTVPHSRTAACGRWPLSPVLMVASYGLLWGHSNRSLKEVTRVKCV